MFEGGEDDKLVLIVEDDTALAKLMQAALDYEPGYRAVAAGTATQALREIRSSPPDLILMDFMLPDFSGLELYDMLRARPDTGHIPVIFVSAYCESPEFKKRGIEDCLPKPFNLEDLLDRVTSVFD